MQEDNFRIKRLVQMSVDNFKTFDGRRDIGPFNDFTCIVGPNGGGKSNIIDALCFVLDISMEEMRIDNWVNLITKKFG